MLVKEIIKDIYMFKEVDWDLKDFHGSLHPLDNGTSYNAYLVIDDKITLIDTMEDEYTEYFIKKLLNVLGNRKIDNIVINHVEPDHAGGYQRIKDLFPDAKTYTSNAGKAAMQKNFFKDNNYLTVKDGDTINIGKRNIVFYQTPFVHWPDNMVTYLKEDKVLFSNDAFGQHITSSTIFADDMDFQVVRESAKEYYANIVLPYNKQVRGVLDKLSGLSIEYILPSHGVGYKNTIKDIVEAYKSWSSDEVKRKAIIVYDSVWGNTKELSLAIGETLYDCNYEVRRYNLRQMRSSTIIKELMDSELICIGSGNYNNTMSPLVASFLERIHGASLKNRKGFAFGSYGWNKTSIPRINNRLKEAGIEVISEDFYVKYVPTEEELKQIIENINKIV